MLRRATLKLQCSITSEQRRWFFILGTGAASQREVSVVGLSLRRPLPDAFSFSSEDLGERRKLSTAESGRIPGCEQIFRVFAPSEWPFVHETWKELSGDIIFLFAKICNAKSTRRNYTFARYLKKYCGLIMESAFMPQDPLPPRDCFTSASHTLFIHKAS